MSSVFTINSYSNSKIIKQVIEVKVQYNNKKNPMKLIIQTWNSAMALCFVFLMQLSIFQHPLNYFVRPRNMSSVIKLGHASC